MTPHRQLIGKRIGGIGHILLREMYERRFPGVPIIEVPSQCTEMAKLVCNSFFSVKIAFFNEMHDWADAEGVDWEALMQAVLSDGRIAHSHTNVPGQDGERGYGGACLPKDIANAASRLERLGLIPHVMSAAIANNNKYRSTAKVGQ